MKLQMKIKGRLTIQIAALLKGFQRAPWEIEPDIGENQTKNTIAKHSRQQSGRTNLLGLVEVHKAYTAVESRYLQCSNVLFWIGFCIGSRGKIAVTAPQ